MRITKSLDYTEKIGKTPLDYVRYATLELIIRKIKGKHIKGWMAEAGVHQGKFASRMNALQPHRVFILIDTFTGFPGPKNKDLPDFSQTSAVEVYERMPHPNNVLIVEGIFPQSVFECEGMSHETIQYVLVSLDMDLEEPMYEGLKYFVPRMTPGGYILMHDYNNDNWPGVKKALERYEAEYGQLQTVPLPDSGGTLVISI